MSLAEALVDLQELTERLRRECPWDREQTERTIVPHTIEEAYEVADAAIGGDDAKLADELGDLLFQVYFLALLLSEKGEIQRTGSSALSAKVSGGAGSVDGSPSGHSRRHPAGSAPPAHRAGSEAPSPTRRADRLRDAARQGAGVVERPT